MVAPPDGERHLRGGHDAVGIGERVQLHTGVERGRRGFVSEHVRAFRNEHLGPRSCEHPDRELVRHRSGGHEECVLLPEQGGRERLQAIDGRVLAVRVVADLGGRHRRAHLVGRPCDGVAAQIDGGAHDAVFATGRMRPSWITVIAS